MRGGESTGKRQLLTRDASMCEAMLASEPSCPWEKQCNGLTAMGKFKPGSVKFAGNARATGTEKRRRVAVVDLIVKVDWAEERGKGEDGRDECVREASMGDGGMDG